MTEEGFSPDHHIYRDDRSPPWGLWLAASSPARAAARLRQVKRILAQWTDQEIATMTGVQATDIILLRHLRQELLEELGAPSTDFAAGDYPA